MPLCTCAVVQGTVVFQVGWGWRAMAPGMQLYELHAWLPLQQRLDILMR